MRIWVDADACPVAVKEILYRAAERRGVALNLVANQWLRVPASPWIRMIQVPAGLDVADTHIAEALAPGDLVVTADVPLAAKVIARGGHVIDPRGERLDAENVQERLAMRNFMDELRSGGLNLGGPSAYGSADRQRFANALDSVLSRFVR